VSSRFIARPLLLFIIVAISTFSLGQTMSDSVWMATPDEAARIARFEAGLAKFEAKGQPPIQMSLQQWMKTFNIPGLSVAVFDHGKLVWAKGYGVKEAGKNSPVTVHTLFQAASISKPVTALATLHYVEAGKFSLDENVNDKLVSWKVPENEFTKEQKVSLRRILSHSAGTTVHGFAGYAVGEKLPTIVQILNGEPPANNQPVRVDAIPGTKFNYSGGGVTIEQLILIDQLKRPFPEIMKETVITPLGLKDSTYEQPLPADRASNAATAHNAAGTVIAGKWHVYPEMAAAGLWTTPSDLARVAFEVSAAKKGASNRVISQGMAKQMLTVQAEPAGLGFFLRPNSDEFGHGGSNEGFMSNLTAFSDTGSGIAIMANSDNGLMIFGRLIESAAKEYNWTSFHAQPEPVFMKLVTETQVHGLSAALALYGAMKAEGRAKDFSANDLTGLGYMRLSADDTAGAITVFEENVRLYPEDSNAFDSLGEGYMKAGKKDAAITNYKKSLELNPKNDNAINMLKKLGVDWKPER
jgi:CubicO group peptidase (beta-lactamase class C family)